MTANLEAYEGSSIAFEFENIGTAVFDKRCPICAKFLKWNKKYSLRMRLSDNDIKPKPVCKVHGEVQPIFEGWF